MKTKLLSLVGAFNRGRSAAILYISMMRKGWRHQVVHPFTRKFYCKRFTLAGGHSITCNARTLESARRYEDLYSEPQPPPTTPHAKNTC